jgi:hypothetical protein
LEEEVLQGAEVLLVLQQQVHLVAVSSASQLP